MRTINNLQTREEYEKQRHFCRCSYLYYLASCVESLLSVALFGCSLIIG